MAARMRSHHRVLAVDSDVPYDDDSDAADFASPSKRRRVARASTPPVTPPSRARRSQRSSAKSERSRALEQLKMIKAGRGRPGSDVEEDEEEQNDVDEQLDQEAQDAIPLTQRGLPVDDDNDDYEDDGFVVRDADDESADESFVGHHRQASQSQLPRGTRVPASEAIEDSFETYIQFLASVAIDRDFASLVLDDPTDTYFLPSLRHVNGRIDAVKTFLVSSSVWRPSFRTSIETYAGFSQATFLSGPPLPCAACSRSQHWAVVEVRLHGPRYDSRTLAPLNAPQDDPFCITMAEEDEEEEEEEEERRRGRDARQGEDAHGRGEEAATPRVALLGRSCARRAEMYHRLHHFPFRLAQAVRQHVAAQMEDGGAAAVDEERGKRVITDLLSNAALIATWRADFERLLRDSERFVRR